jgi:coenzyme F420-reducing hydrogenase alpha subunit
MQRVLAVLEAVEQALHLELQDLVQQTREVAVVAHYMLAVAVYLGLAGQELF